MRPNVLSDNSTARCLQFALADAPLTNSAGLHSRVLLETPVALFAPEALTRKLRKDFPSKLGGAPVLMTSEGTLRRKVEPWITERKLELEKWAEMPYPETFAALPQELPSLHHGCCVTHCKPRTASCPSANLTACAGAHS